MLKQNIPNPSSLEKKYLSDYFKNLGSFYTRKGEYKNALNCYLKINQIIIKSQKDCPFNHIFYLFESG